MKYLITRTCNSMQTVSKTWSKMNIWNVILFVCLFYWKISFQKTHIFSNMFLKFFWYVLISEKVQRLKVGQVFSVDSSLKIIKISRYQLYDSYPLLFTLLRESGYTQWFRSIANADYEPITWQILTPSNLSCRIVPHNADIHWKVSRYAKQAPSFS